MDTKVGDKLTSDCGGCGLTGEMVVTKIVTVDPELDVFMPAFDLRHRNA